MNMLDLKADLNLKAGRTSLYLQKYSPEILLTAGLLGMAATIVMAAKATLKAQNILDDHEAKMDKIDEAMTGDTIYTPEDEMKSKAIVFGQTAVEFVKLYGPAAIIGALSTTCILQSHGIMTKRNVALVSAYTLLAEAYKNYRARVVETLGEEKDEEFHHGLREETFTTKEQDADGKTVKTKRKVLVQDATGLSIYAKCFDKSNPNYKRESRLLNAAFLEAQQSYANDLLLLRGHVFLNQIYERLGFPDTKEGQLVGWILQDPIQMKKEGRDGYIKFGLNSHINANEEFMRGENDAIWLDFNVDGIILDKI